MPFTLKPKKRLTSNVYSPDRWYYMNNNNDGYLFSNLNRKTKVQAKDLPEWYVFDYFFHQHAYISAKGVKDLFYVPFWHSFHIDKQIIALDFSMSTYNLIFRCNQSKY